MMMKNFQMAQVACYLELYEEGEVEHINNVWPPN